MRTHTALTTTGWLAAVVAALVFSQPGEGEAGPPKPDGARCNTNQSCQSRICAKAPGAKFGVCCTRSATTDATCNGLDDDCSGVADEDYVSQATTCGVGECASTGAITCVSGEEQDSCTPQEPAEGQEFESACADNLDVTVHRVNSCSIAS